MQVRIWQPGSGNVSVALLKGHRKGITALVRDGEGRALCVPNLTLYANPSGVGARPPEPAQPPRRLQQQGQHGAGVGCHHQVRDWSEGIAHLRPDP